MISGLRKGLDLIQPPFYGCYENDRIMWERNQTHRIQRKDVWIVFDPVHEGTADCLDLRLGLLPSGSFKCKNGVDNLLGSSLETCPK